MTHNIIRFKIQKKLPKVLKNSLLHFYWKKKAGNFGATFSLLFNLPRNNFLTIVFFHKKTIVEQDLIEKVANDVYNT